MLPQLYYISQSTSKTTHIQAIESACEAGCKLIQLRIKGLSMAEVLLLAQQAKKICEQYTAKLIINDFPEVALAIKADGVHLGKQDRPHKVVRKLLGKDILIGGTANTFQDIQRYADEGAVDYIGLGPFRFTSTKQNLSPTLGVKGYQQILEQCRAVEIKLPIFALGGIETTDIAELMITGIHGIAVSGLLTNAQDKPQTVQQIQNLLSV